MKPCRVSAMTQSTRSARFDPVAFNSLGVKLAKKTGTWVVPVAMKTDFQANGQIIKEAGQVNPKKQVHVALGRPMPVTGNGQATHQRVVAFIEDHLARWGADRLPSEG